MRSFMSLLISVFLSPICASVKGSRDETTSPPSPLANSTMRNINPECFGYEPYWPELCCPDAQGHGGFIYCFTEEWPLQRCCGPQAFMEVPRDLISTYIEAHYPFEDNPRGPDLYAPIFALLLNGQNDQESDDVRIMVEIGFSPGRFAKTLLEIVDFPLEYYAIDPWRPASGPSVTLSPECGRWRPMGEAEMGQNPEENRLSGKGDYCTTSTDDQWDKMSDTMELLKPFWDRVRILQLYPMQAVRVFEDESITLLFIDGSHSEEAVREELNNYWPKVRGGGIMGGHDYGFEGVQKAVKAFAHEMHLTLKVVNLEGFKRKRAFCWYIIKEYIL